jgi:beta-galactosidase
MKPISLLLFSLLATAPATALAKSGVTSQHQEVNLQQGWLFSRDSLHWQSVAIPHDWAISGPFDKKWDLQYVAITQNGEKEKSEKSGRSGALPWIGRGFYRRTLTVPKNAAHAYLQFDGAMSEPHVYVNGKLAGWWAYGYNAFRIDITPYIYKGRSNEVVVSLNNREESSRWYPGGGLYRPVSLILTGKAYLDPWQSFLYTEKANAAEATLVYNDNVKGGQGEQLSERIQLYAPNGQVAATAEGKVGSNGKVSLRLKVARPQLWSPESPALYRAKIELIEGEGRRATVVDSRTMKTGIRTIAFSREHGFQLNGVSRKFQGVCLHHDLGPLGAAVNKAALIRQVKILKDMGCDAIRTSHNMPSTMQMEVYDSLGMMVMAESFDMWRYPKCKNGYARFFDKWADKDIEHLVLNHRNHPSLVMYSIGNEIPEQWSQEGADIARRLQDICHRLDPTRLVTQGMDRAEDALKSGFAQVMDIPGFNYRVYKYDRNISQLPQGFLLGSETASTVSSRGVYKFPVTVSDKNVYPDGQCSGYDTEYCPWSNLPESDFMAQDDKDYTIGQFVWTGFDYLGEPTPYDSYWPSRSSYFGICDLAGLPKDRYYLYRSVWNRHDHTIHLLPHWTWPGREGKVTPVMCYTDYDEAELFVNGKSQGLRHKTGRMSVSATAGKLIENMDKELVDSLLSRYRLVWDNVVYEPGELKVVVYDKNGKAAGEETVHTAGAPAALRLTADKQMLAADGNDLSYITVALTDKDGNICPDAADDIRVEVSGAGTFQGICNGDATSLERFTEPHMHLFHGMLVATVRSEHKPGTITVKISTASGISQTISIAVK